MERTKGLGVWRQWREFGGILKHAVRSRSTPLGGHMFAFHDRPKARRLNRHWGSYVCSLHLENMTNSFLENLKCRGGLASSFRVRAEGSAALWGQGRPSTKDWTWWAATRTVLLRSCPTEANWGASRPPQIMLTKTHGLSQANCSWGCRRHMKSAKKPPQCPDEKESECIL